MIILDVKNDGWFEPEINETDTNNEEELKIDLYLDRSLEDDIRD